MSDEPRSTPLGSPVADLITAVGGTLIGDLAVAVQLSQRTMAVGSTPEDVRRAESRLAMIEGAIDTAEGENLRAVVRSCDSYRAVLGDLLYRARLLVESYGGKGGA
jgi:hypothetical protein